MPVAFVGLYVDMYYMKYTTEVIQKKLTALSTRTYYSYCLANHMQDRIATFANSSSVYFWFSYAVIVSWFPTETCQPSTSIHIIFK